MRELKQSVYSPIDLDLSSLKWINLVINVSWESQWYAAKDKNKKKSDQVLASERGVYI